MASYPLLPRVVQARATRAGLSVTAFQNVKAGNVLIAFLELEAGSGVGVSDSLSTSYSLAASNSANGLTAYIFIGTAASSGANTITFSVTGASIPNCGFAEFANVTATVDAVVSDGFTGSPSTVTTSNLTTTLGQELLICYIAGFRNAGRFMAGTGFTQLFETTTQDSSAAEFKITGFSGSYNATFSNTGNDQGCSILLALKAKTSLTIVTQVVPDGALSTAYNYTLQASGGVGTYTWAIASGTLPANLTLSTAGLISGTITNTSLGTNVINFQVTDGTTTTTKPLMLGVGQSYGTPTHVQGTGGGKTTGAVSSIALPSPVNCDDIILVAAFGGGNADLFPISDSIGSDYQLIGARSDNPNASSVSGYVSLWAAQAATTGTNTVSSGGAAQAMIVSEFSGVQNFNDSFVITTGSTSSGTITSGTITSLVPTELLYTLVGGFSNSAIVSINSPFIQEAQVNGNNPFQEDASGYLVVTSSAGYAPTYTLASNTFGLWSTIVSGFRPELPICSPTLLPGGGTSTFTSSSTSTVTNTTTTTTTTTVTAGTSTGISANTANFKLFDHTNAARPEPPRVLTFDSDRITGGEVWFREVRSDLNAYNGTVTGVIYVDENIISTFSCIGLVGGTGGTGRTVYPNPFPAETYGKAIYIRYSSTTPFKHYRTWYESEIQPDRMTFWEASYETTPSVGVIKTWLSEVNPLGGGVIGTLLIDGVAVMTSTFLGAQRRVFEIGLPNITTGKVIKAIYNGITPIQTFKWWKTHYEIDAKPFLKTTWNVIYRKIGGATQLDMARFWSLDVEVPAASGGTLSGTSTITSTWQADGTAVLTNTYTLTNTRTYIDRISFPPGIHAYLFQQQISADQPFHLWKSNLDIERIGVKGFSRVTLDGTPIEQQGIAEPPYPRQIKPWTANYQ